MKLFAMILGLATSVNAFGQTKQLKRFVAITPAELTAIISESQMIKAAPQDMQESLLKTLSANGRVIVVETADTYNCDGHACDHTGPARQNSLSLLDSLQRQNRIFLFNSSESMNCDGHACDSTTGR